VQEFLRYAIPHAFLALGALRGRRFRRHRHKASAAGHGLGRCRDDLIDSVAEARGRGGVDSGCGEAVC